MCCTLGKGRGEDTGETHEGDRQGGGEEMKWMLEHKNKGWRLESRTSELNHWKTGNSRPSERNKLEILTQVTNRTNNEKLKAGIQEISHLRKSKTQSLTIDAFKYMNSWSLLGKTDYK